MSIVSVSFAANYAEKSPAAIRQWLKRRKLTHHGYDDDGRALVDLSEVDKLAYPPPTNARLNVYYTPTAGQYGDMINTEQAAEGMGVSTSTIRTWVSRGQLKVSGLDDRGRNLYYTVDVAKAEAATAKRERRMQEAPIERACMMLLGRMPDDEHEVDPDKLHKLDDVPRFQRPRVIVDWFPESRAAMWLKDNHPELLGVVADKM